MATNKTKALAKAVKPAGPKIKTGILVSYVGAYATVNIEGAELLMPMLDSVDTAVPVGSTVVCQVYGGTGYVIGALGNANRTASGTFTGSYYNPPVPRPSNLGYQYTNFTARQIGTFNTAALPYTVTSTTTLFADNTGSTTNTGYWFYGANAFSSLTGKTIQSVEIYVSPFLLDTNTYPMTFISHKAATRPSTTFTQGIGSTNSSMSGWVTLGTDFVNELKTNLSAWGVGFISNTTANLRPSAPYGTLRVGWTN